HDRAFSRSLRDGQAAAVDVARVERRRGRIGRRARLPPTPPPRPPAPRGPPKPRPWTWLASKAEGGGLLGALGSHYIDALRHWFGEVASVSGRLDILRPDLLDAATNRVVRAETDDT